MVNPAEDLIQLSALIDGELDGIEAGRIRQHLAQSALLQDDYRRTKALCELLERWDRIDSRDIAASPRYQATLLERLRRLRASERQANSLVITLSEVSRN
jgi:hypothetical protein